MEHLECCYCGAKALGKLKGLPFCDECLENMAHFEDEDQEEGDCESDNCTD